MCSFPTVLGGVKNHGTEDCPFGDYRLALTMAWKEGVLKGYSGRARTNDEFFRDITTTKDSLGIPLSLELLYSAWKRK